MQPVCFLYNPTAGETVITEWLDTIISIYQRRGCTIVPYRLGFRAGEPELIADLLGHGYRHVLVAGGDGTVKKQPRKVKKIGRNDPCPCGSGKKYKQCCGR